MLQKELQIFFSIGNLYVLNDIDIKTANGIQVYGKLFFFLSKPFKMFAVINFLLNGNLENSM